MVSPSRNGQANIHCLEGSSDVLPRQASVTLGLVEQSVPRGAKHDTPSPASRGSIAVRFSAAAVTRLPSRGLVAGARDVLDDVVDDRVLFGAARRLCPGVTLLHWRKSLL